MTLPLSSPSPAGLLATPITELLRDPALGELLFSTGLSLGLLALGALTIASLPWTDAELRQVDRAAHHLLTRTPGRLLAPLRARVLALTVRG